MEMPYNGISDQQDASFIISAASAEMLHGVV
jgi:hypothetical protein